MKDDPERVSLIWLLLAALVVVVIVFDVAYAGDDKTIQSNDMNAQTAGDFIIKGSKALGLSYGMGDVDINEGQNCMGSEQKANILFGKQELALNAWCASLFYELNGRHTFAAKLRCSIPEIGNHYLTSGECVADQVLSPSNITEPSVIDLHEEQRVQDEGIAIVQMAQASFADRLEALERKPLVTKSQAPPPEKEMTIEEKEAVLALLFSNKDDGDE